jgi:nitrogen fixation NifU-like protein
MADDDPSSFLEMIQKEINEGYSEVVLDHAMNPRNMGRIEDHDGFASFAGPCGDNIMIWLKVKDNGIEDARFWTDGCGTAIACGSMITEMAKGRTTDETARIEQADILEEPKVCPWKATIAHCSPQLPSRCPSMILNAGKSAVDMRLIHATTKF